MMQTTFLQTTNQSPENNLTPRIKITLTRTGILDCRGKLEQITLIDSEIYNFF